MEINQLTKEQRADFEKRQDAFLAAYKKLIDKYQMDFISLPLYVPQQDGTFGTRIETQIMDKKYWNVPSPIVI